MKTYKSILLIIIISLIPFLLTGLFPLTIYNQMKVDETSYGTTSSFIIPANYWKIYLKKGEDYTIQVWDPDITDYVVRIGNSPYMITGKKIDGDGSGVYKEIMVFQPSRTGDHYIQVINKDNTYGSFEITIRLGVVGTHIGQPEDFFGVGCLLVLISPSLIFFLIGISVFLMKRKRKKKESSYQKTELNGNVHKKEDKVEPTIKERNEVQESQEPQIDSEDFTGKKKIKWENALYTKKSVIFAYLTIIFPFIAIILYYLSWDQSRLSVNWEDGEWNYQIFPISLLSAIVCHIMILVSAYLSQEFYNLAVQFKEPPYKYDKLIIEIERIAVIGAGITLLIVLFLSWQFQGFIN